MAVYNKVKEIESIIKGRGPLVKVPHEIAKTEEKKSSVFDQVSTSTIFSNPKESFASK